jgi:circadian clock protein KaiB
MATPRDVSRSFEQGLRHVEQRKFVLRLYVAGSTPQSTSAIKNIKKICHEHLQGRYELEVVDVYQQVALARKEQVIAVPTLIKKLPAPLSRLIGDLSDRERVLIGLDLKPKSIKHAQATTQVSKRKRGQH